MRLPKVLVLALLGLSTQAQGFEAFKRTDSIRQLVDKLNTNFVQAAVGLDSRVPYQGAVTNVDLGGHTLSNAVIQLSSITNFTYRGSGGGPGPMGVVFVNRYDPYGGYCFGLTGSPSQVAAVTGTPAEDNMVWVGIRNGPNRWTNQLILAGLTMTGDVNMQSNRVLNADIPGYLRPAYTGDVRIVGSTAFGTNVTASGEFAHAEGRYNIASGDASHAEGRYNIASGEFAHAEGMETRAEGQAAHAEGQLTQALGDSSHAEGYETIASGDSSHAEGSESEASGEFSHAEGYRTLAAGQVSHAAGKGSRATNNHSFVWSSDDIYGADLGSPGDNSFTVNAAGGVHLRGGVTARDGLRVGGKPEEDGKLQLWDVANEDYMPFWYTDGRIVFGTNVTLIEDVYSSVSAPPVFFGGLYRSSMFSSIPIRGPVDHQNTAITNVSEVSTKALTVNGVTVTNLLGTNAFVATGCASGNSKAYAWSSAGIHLQAGTNAFSQHITSIDDDTQIVLPARTSDFENIHLVIPATGGHTIEWVCASAPIHGHVPSCSETNASVVLVYGDVTGGWRLRRFR